MRRAVSVAAGSLAAALTADLLGGPGGALAASQIAILGGAAATIAVVVAAISLSLRPPRGPTVVAVAVGVALVAGRLTLGAIGSTPDAVLPEGEGEWTGSVAAVSTPKDGTQRFVLTLDGTGLRVDVRSGRYPEVGAGDPVEVAGDFRRPPDDGYGSSLIQRGLAGVIEARRLTLQASDRGPLAAPAAVRTAGDAGLRLAIPEPESGLAAGILLGMRDRVDRSVATDFATTGMSHIVAISGWNIAIVVVALGVALGRLRRRPRTIATLVVVVAYVAVVGATPPVVRAALMAAIVLVARETGRRAAAAAALAWAVVVMLALDPATIADPGFRLSSAATAGLLAWGTPLTERIAGLARGRLPGWVVETLGVSLAAQAATLPIIILGFGRISIVSTAANLVAAPVVPLSMGAGAIALVGGTAVAFLGLPPAIAALVGIPAWVALGALVAVASVAARLPLASMTLGPPWDLVGAAVAAAGLVVVGVPALRRRFGAAAGRLRRRLGWGHDHRRERRSPVEAAGGGARRGAVETAGGGARGAVEAAGGGARRGAARGSQRRAFRVAAVCIAIALVATIVGAARLPDGRAHVVVLDVGQGDAILVLGERGGRLLVDGGPDPERLVAALDARIPPWDRRIDVVVLTHPHDDHVAGLPLLLGRYTVGRAFEPGLDAPSPAYRAWREALRAHAIPSVDLVTGDVLHVDGVTLRVLWPDPGRAAGEPAEDGRGINDVSIVLLGEAGGGRFLLTGDAEDDVDPIILSRSLPPVDLLKVAHHGSRTATSTALLDATAPAVAIVSVGAKNRYGHPSSDTLERISAHGARVLRTDREGTVDASFGDARVEVRRERSAGDGATAAPGASGAAGASASPGASSAAGTLPSTPRATARRWTPDLAATPAAHAPAAHVPAPPNERDDDGPTAALLYHRTDGRPRARRGRGAPSFPRSPTLVPPPCSRGRGGGGLARRARGGGRPRPGSSARGGGRAPP
jgi:competence protein ComEC